MALLEVPILQIIAVAGAVAFTWFSVAHLRSWSRKIPGPWLAKYTNLWYAWELHKHDFHFTNVQLHREKGRIVQVMPNHFSIDDPEAHKKIYGHGVEFPKSEWYAAWNISPDPELTNLFTEIRPPNHAAMRRKFAGMYSMTSLVSYETYVDACIELLQGHFVKIAESATTINLGYWLQCYAFDVVSMITFGERLGFLDEGKDIENLIANLEGDFSFFNFLALWPKTKPVMDWVAGILSGGKILFFQRFVTEKLEIARKENSDLPEHGPIYMVRKFLDAQRKDDKKRMTDWDVAANAGSNIGAGSDTTAISLSNILYNIFQNPHVLKKARKEIEEYALPARPSFQEVQKMPYLQAVIKESMRLHPALGLPLWRRVPKGGATISDQYFPEGANVGVNVWVAHRNQNVYGPDADEFRPERWLDSDKKESSDATKARDQQFMSFGLGSRTCIGKNIALLEMNKLIPILVRDYDFRFYHRDGAPMRQKSIPGRNLWFVKPTDDFCARLTKREDTLA